MHGRGSDENDLAALVPALPAEFAYAAVRAPIAEGPGWSWFEDGDGNVRADPRRRTPTAPRTPCSTGSTTSAGRRRSSAPSGFSQGGAWRRTLLRRDPGRVRFAVNLAGFIVSGEQPTDGALAVAQPPVFWGRGADDELFTPRRSWTRTAPWLEAHTDLDGARVSGARPLDLARGTG